ncbi:receptor-like protein kinase 7 [Cornus florida]|uniref:receptor-like protein kinase 7 n=1 Tax=Cornus florida TaxID=4283 RepID=UPI0028A1BC73|nr:receptor-like protein kinase 7 [Cornus florida]
MPTPHIIRQLPSLAFLSILCFLSILSPSQSDDLQTLLKFKTIFQNSNPQVFSTWTPQNSICNFTGIICDSSNQLVREINLSDQQLLGTLPFDSICDLQSLEKLSFGQNFLYGNITDHLKNCTRLRYLDLGNNSFSGKVPDLSSLSQLEFLNLNHSGFSGQFPWKSLENLTSLTFLSLGDNPFDKNSFPLEVLKLEKLYWLYLTNCSLEGKIPEKIGNLSVLENLELSDNHLFGEIPEGITKLTRLTQLELYDNTLTGKLPIGFGNLTNLINFDASNNSLEGDLSELKSLTQLASLHLFENQFSGEIPEEFGEFKSLVEFSLYTNKLTGSLPQKIGSWADLIYIDVSENYLTGSIPPDMCKNGKLTDLLLLQNKLTGDIPATYVNCSSLVRLRVNNNSLSGTVPDGIWGLPELGIIDLSLNQFVGSVTTHIGDAKSLAQLFLANNKFSGELPMRVSEASSLVAISLSGNQFSGNIPATIGELKKLSSLHLEDNQFSGIIPDSIGSCVSLNDVNLAGNSLSGEIPATIGSLPSLNSLNLSNNKLSGEIPASLASVRLSLLDLSSNRLIGSIPESLATGSFAGNPGLCSQSIRNFRACSSDSGKTTQIGTVIYCLIAGGTVLIVSLAGFMYMKFRHKNKNSPIKGGYSWDMKQFHVLSFDELDILNSIKDDNLIGKGGSGNVYKVTLGGGQHLAVKHIWRSDSGDWKSSRSTSPVLAKGKLQSPEYDAEVATLSSVRHVNVVKLYCSITSEDSNLLVYEYMPNGSLWDRLHTCKKIGLEWVVRYEIAMGAARGLEYLHHGCDRPVIHRDVKSSNILLDEHMKPRIADFGLAKILQASGVRDSTHIIAGTHGYIAPEYAYTCKVNEKSDVYSFGVVLMELVTGKRPVEPEFGENKDIVQWVCSKMRSQDSLLDLVDSSLSQAMKEDAVKVLRIAAHCTAKIPAVRPSMRMVVKMLEEAEPFKLSSIIVNQRG